MSCDVGEVTESFENQNELWRRWSDGKDGEWALLHLRHSSYSNPSVALPMSQLILQPFRCFTYVTTHSPTLLSLLLRHWLFTYVTWRTAHEVCKFLNPLPFPVISMRLLWRDLFCSGYLNFTAILVNFGWRLAYDKLAYRPNVQNFINIYVKTFPFYYPERYSVKLVLVCFTTQEEGKGTPVHIQPEWYFLFVYAILRSIPNKSTISSSDRFEEHFPIVRLYITDLD